MFEGAPERQIEKPKQKIFPEVPIPEKFQGGFPEGYRPWIAGWSFKPDELKETLPDGTFKMLTLDVSICIEEWAKEMNKIEDPVERDKKIRETYKCPNRCGTCFEKNAKNNGYLMLWEENKKLIDDAYELGLRTVKFLGPGEIVNNPELFKYLDYFEEKGLAFGIFTKPSVLLNEQEAQKTFGMSAEEMCKKLASYKCVRLLMNFTSADPKTEKKMVDPQDEDYAETFFEDRNKAIELFCKYGLNSDPNEQRLALICAPVIKANIDEAFDIFKWGTERNIPVVVAPTMLSGGCSLMLEEVRDKEFKEKGIVGLWTDIYVWLIKNNIITIEQLEKEGVAPYAGFSCDQFISGMFVRKDGNVQACPGNETEEFRYSRNVREDNLEEVWKNSMGYKMRTEMVKSGEIKQLGCPAKQPLIAFDGEGVPLIDKGSGSFPEDFGEKVIAKVKEKISAE